MWGDIVEIIKDIGAWWTPEKVRSRARRKLERLKKERNELLKKEATPANVRRMQYLLRNIARLHNYLKED